MRRLSTSALVLAFAAFGCTRLSNRHDDVTLVCGAESRSGSAFVKVIGTDGAPLTAADVIAELGDAPLAVTSRGCAALPENAAGELVVRHSAVSAAARLALAPTDLPELRTVQLTPYRQPYAIWKTCGDFALDLGVTPQTILKPGAQGKAALTGVKAKLESADGLASLPVSERGCIALPADARGALTVTAEDQTLGAFLELRGPIVDRSVVPLPLMTVPDAAWFEQCGAVPVTAPSDLSRRFVKVYRENDREALPSDALSAYELDATGVRGAALTVTPRGCVLVPGDDRPFVVTRHGTPEGLVSSGARNGAKLTLRRFSVSGVGLACPPSSQRPGKVSLTALAEADDTLPAYAFSARLVRQSDGASLKTALWLDRDSPGFDLDLGDLAEGAYTVEWSARRLVEGGDASRAQVRATCPVRVDATPPTVAVALGEARDLAGERRFVRGPGETIAFSVTSDEPAGLRLFHRMDDEPFTEGPRVIAAPDRGAHVLEWYAVDAAGNASPVERRELVVIHDITIALIQSLVQSAVAKTKTNDEIGALKTLLAADQLRRGLA